MATPALNKAAGRTRKAIGSQATGAIGRVKRGIGRATSPITGLFKGDQHILSDTIESRYKDAPFAHEAGRQLRERYGTGVLGKAKSKAYWNRMSADRKNRIGVHTRRYEYTREAPSFGDISGKETEIDRTLADVDFYTKREDFETFAQSFATGQFADPYTIYHTFGLEAEARLADTGNEGLAAQARTAERGEEMAGVSRIDYNFFDVDEETRQHLLEYESEARDAYANTFFGRNV